MPRRTEIQDSEAEIDMEQPSSCVKTWCDGNPGGYIKRVPLKLAYRAQKRGGKGRSGMSLRDEDFTTELFVASTHAPVLFFSLTGSGLQTESLPSATTPQARGKALVNIFPLKAGETINSFMTLPEDEAIGASCISSRPRRAMRRNDLSDFKLVQSNGKIAIRMDEDDKLVGVRTCAEEDHVLLATSGGKAMRFPVDAVRVFKSRTSDGVRGMKLADKDEVVSISILHGIRASAEEREAFRKFARPSAALR